MGLAAIFRIVLNDKASVVRALREMGQLLQIGGENPFKTRAYDIAADRVAGLTEELPDLVAQGKLTSFPGIGESIAAKITELVTTGKLGALEALKAKYPPRFLELLTVQDLGPKKAKALFEALGVGSIDELEAACRAGKVAALKGFGEKTQIKLLAGLELSRRTQGGARRRLAEVLPRAQLLLQHVLAAPGVTRASLGGSVRRMRETVADVDIIAAAPDAAAVFTWFEQHP
jgi:DNA polymerase (family X)